MKLIAGALAGCLGLPVLAQSLSDLTGTIEVAHQRQQSRGVLEGCSVVFRAAVPDHAYRKGQMVMVAGSFTFYVLGPQSAFLAIKAGVKDLEGRHGDMASPAFAYLQTNGASTATARSVQRGSADPGFGLWVVGLETGVAGLLGEVLEGGAVTLGMTRQGGSLDILVPLDLTVASTQVGKDGKVTRQRSEAALQEFRDCFVSLTSTLRQ